MRKDIIDLAKQAGLEWDMTPRLGAWLERFYDLAVAGEREECASLCDLYAMPDGTSAAAIHLAIAIRARGRK